MAASSDANDGGWHTCDSGATPVTATTLAGARGSFVDSVMFADLLPAEVGWNRTGTTTVSPGATVNGNVSTCGTRNSGDEEEIAVNCRSA